MENVTVFKYLGQVMTEGDYEWPKVVGCLQSSRNSLGRLLRILSREGSDLKVTGNFKGDDAGVVVVWGIDVGTKPQDGAGPWCFPTQTHVTAHREASKETGVW